MEEIRSTEILDREIQEDARRKAERILENAEKEIQKVFSDTAERVEMARKEKKCFYDEKSARFMRDKNAALPLEKERFLVSYENGAVSQAFDAYLDSLPVEKQLLLLEKLMRRYIPILRGKKVTVQVYGFETQSVQLLAEKMLGTENIVSVTMMNGVKASELYIHTHEIHVGEGILRGFVIETDDRRIVCRVTLDEIIEHYMDTHSYELASSLFGGRLPE